MTFNRDDVYAAVANRAKFINTILTRALNGEVTAPTPAELLSFLGQMQDMLFSISPRPPAVEPKPETEVKPLTE